MAKELFSGINKTVSFSIPVETLNLIDVYQRRNDLKTRAEAIRHLVYFALDQERVSIAWGQIEWEKMKKKD